MFFHTALNLSKISQGFNAKCPLKDHTYLNKPVAFSSRFVKVSMHKLLVDTSLGGNILSC